MKLTGVAKRFNWKGHHPVTKAKMQVIVFSWTPSGREFSGRLKDAADKAEKEMQTQPTSSNASQGSGSQNSNKTKELVPTRTRKGATTKKKKW